MNNNNSAQLLSMLKSIGPVTPSSNTQPSSQGGLAPPSGGTASPREPSPAPPPPSLQAVSLSDLFASISPPPPQQQAQAAYQPLAGSGSAAIGGNHQDALMSMLNTIAKSPNTFPPPPQIGATNGSPTPMDVVPSPSVAPVSGSSTPGVASGEGHKQNLLSMFKSPPPTGQVGLPDTSARSTPAAAQQAVPQPSAPLPPASEPQHYIAPPSETAPIQAAPPNAAPPPPKKSMFDFVSPFDAFERPVPTPSPGQNVKPAKAIAPPVMDATLSSTTVSGIPATTVPASGFTSPQRLSTPPLPIGPPPAINNKSKPKAASGKGVPAVQHGELRQRAPSSTSTAASGTKDLGLPWLVSKVVDKGAVGEGPAQISTSNIVIDVSKTNLPSLVNSQGVVQIIPTTIMKSDNVGFSQGRSVATTSEWVGYALPKARVRLIDRASGSRAVLSIPNVNSGTVVDIAVTPNYVAIVGPDHSVTVQKVPSSWDQDAPPVELILHISARGAESDKDVAGIGRAIKVEWIRRDGGDLLAIGGSEGVVVIKPTDLVDEQNLTFAELARRYKVLKTDGPMVSFCLNHSQQALAFLSTKSYLTLYNVSTLNRVWHRQLPSSADAGPPSSVQFCETMLLVGRKNNTIYDLIQITVDLAVLSTIKFVAPPPSPVPLHFSQAVYDPSRRTLWVSSFARGSVFGFRYALSGSPPIKVAERPNGVVAFDKIGEYPLNESILSLALSTSSPSGEEDLELFFATPTGFNHATIDKAACEALSSAPATTTVQSAAAPVPVSTAAAAPPPAVPSPKVQPKKESPAPAAKKQEQSAKRAAAPKAQARTPVKGSPVVVKKELEEVDTMTEQNVNGQLEENNLGELLKKSEDQITANFKRILNAQIGQVTSRIDNLPNGNLANGIANEVENRVNASLSAIIQAELKKSVLPAIQASIQNEVRSAVSASVSASVSGSMQALSKDLERTLAPSLQRMSTTVQQNVERTFQATLQSAILPAINASSSKVAAQLSTELKSELLQFRKDFSPPRQEPQLDSEPLLRSMASAIAELQHQVSSLSAQLSSRGPVVPPPGAPISLPPPPPSVPQAPPIEQPGRSLDDRTLDTLAINSPAATIAYVNEYWAATEQILPENGRRCQLTQPTLLTLLHRLSTSLIEVIPVDPTFGRIITWLRRTIPLLDPRSEAISRFWNRVVPVVQATLQNTLLKINAGFNGDQSVSAVVNEATMAVRGVIELVAAKQA